jgi:hypothetical protein
MATKPFSRPQHTLTCSVAAMQVGDSRSLSGTVLQERGEHSAKGAAASKEPKQGCSKGSKCQQGHQLSMGPRVAWHCRQHTSTPPSMTSSSMACGDVS